jgi:hypothetical protein
MYCNQCGKFIENGVVCEDCSKKIRSRRKEETVVDGSTHNKNVRLAVSCFVVAIVALVLVMIAFGFLFPIMIEVHNSGYTAECITYLVIYLVAILILMAISIVILILGIKAIKMFVRSKRNKEKTKVANLVFGIISVVISSIVLLYTSVLVMFPTVMLATHIVPTITINGKII